jgi:hypothetical protein
MYTVETVYNSIFNRFLFIIIFIPGEAPEDGEAGDDGNFEGFSVTQMFLSFLLSSYMEYIESIGFTPKILKICFCSNHVFYRYKVIK